MLSQNWKNRHISLGFGRRSSGNLSILLRLTKDGAACFKATSIRSPRDMVVGRSVGDSIRVGDTKRPRKKKSEKSTWQGHTVRLSVKEDFRLPHPTEPKMEAEEEEEGRPRRPQVLWLNIPRPEEIVIVFVVFAIVVYLLFVIMLGGHLLAFLMATLSSVLGCVVIVGLGRISQIIAERRKAPL